MSQKYIPTNNVNFVVDPKTRAIININDLDKALYKERKDNILRENKLRDELKDREKDVQQLKNEVNQIKEMLEKLLK